MKNIGDYKKFGVPTLHHNTLSFADRRGRLALSTSVNKQRPPEVRSASAKKQGAWQDIKEQSVMAFESGLLPSFIDSRQKAITIALMGSELGLSPMQALCGIYVVNGMTALRGALMLRLIYERVPGAMITVLTSPERANEECTVEMQRPNGRMHTFRFTVDEAKKAGFWNNPIWRQHTATMLRWAAIRTGARVVFADAIAGCYMEDEIPDWSGAKPKKLKNSPPAPELPSEQKVREELPETPLGETPWRSPRMEVRDVGHGKITEKQVKRLYAIAHQKNWSRARIVSWMADWFAKKEPKELTRDQYDRLCNFILSQ